MKTTVRTDTKTRPLNVFDLAHVIGAADEAGLPPVVDFVVGHTRAVLFVADNAAVRTWAERLESPAATEDDGRLVTGFGGHGYHFRVTTKGGK